MYTHLESTEKIIFIFVEDINSSKSKFNFVLKGYFELLPCLNGSLLKYLSIRKKVTIFPSNYENVIKKYFSAIFSCKLKVVTMLFVIDGWLQVNSFCQVKEKQIKHYLIHG